MAIEKATDGLSEEMKDHDAQEHRRGMAIGLAQNFARAANSEGHAYLKNVNEPNWMPHDWVIAAIQRGVELGKELGERTAGEKHLYVQDQLDEHYRNQQPTVIRACIAAVMEAGVTHNAADGPGVIKCTMNLEKQATIWDRFELETERNKEETEVTFSLYPKL